MSGHQELEVVDELVECSRCRGFTHCPDSHILGPEARWTGGPLPMMRYCTPFGVELRPPQSFSEPHGEQWRWTTSGYRRIGGDVIE